MCWCGAVTRLILEIRESVSSIIIISIKTQKKYFSARIVRKNRVHQPRNTASLIGLKEISQLFRHSNCLREIPLTMVGAIHLDCKINIFFLESVNAYFTRRPKVNTRISVDDLIAWNWNLRLSSLCVLVSFGTVRMIKMELVRIVFVWSRFYSWSWQSRKTDNNEKMRCEIPSGSMRDA